MEHLESTKTSSKGNKKVGWIIAVVLILWVAWVIYTSIQTPQADSASMPADMPGMNASITETEPTEMPTNMPGMNHP